MRSRWGCRSSHGRRGWRGPYRRAESGDVGVVFIAVIAEAVTDPDHQGGTEVAVRRASGFEGGLGLPVFRKEESLEAIGGNVAEASIPIHCANSQIQADYEETIHIAQLHPDFVR